MFVWQGFVIFKTVSGDLSPHLLCSCCNCPFGAMSLACSTSPSLPLAAILFDLSPVFGPSSLLSLYNSLMNPRHVQQTSYLQNCLLFRWFVFLSTVMQLFQYRFAKKWKHGVVTFFSVFQSVPHLCSGWQRIFVPYSAGSSISHLLWMEANYKSGLFHVGPPRLSPSILNTPVLKQGGLLWRIMDVSSCRGSAIGYYHRSYLWAWVARDEWLQALCLSRSITH